MLIHEVPTALDARPIVVLRQIPGVVLRVPARAATIVLAALVPAGALVGLLGASPALGLALLVPAVVLAVLVEVRPGGKPPVHWLVVRLRQQRRAPLLVAQPRTSDVVVRSRL